MLEEKTKAELFKNPSSGIFYRNPTRLEISDRAESQQEIAAMVKGAKVKVGRIVYDYSSSDFDKSDPYPLHGILKIREMDEERLNKFLANVLRYKPSIVRLHILLGSYENKKKVVNTKIDKLNGNAQRFSTDIAKNMAEAMINSKEKIVEVIYKVNSLDPGYFNTSVEMFGVSEEDYNNNDLFKPAIGIEYMENM